MAPLEPGWIEAGHIVQFDEVVAALRRLIKASGSGTRQVALAMPDSAVIVGKIRLPSDLGETELRRQVATEVERLSGKSLTEMSVDYRAQSRTHDSRQGREVEVWIAAAAKDQVQDRLGLAEAAGLDAVILDVEAEASMMAARRLVKTRYSTSTNPLMALIQVETAGYSLHVTHQGEVVHALHKPAVGANPIEQSPQAYPRDKPSDPGQPCQEVLPGTYAQAVLQPWIHGLADSMASELDGFVSASTHQKIDTILLAGGSSHLPALLNAIKRRTFSDCVLVDAFSGMRVNETLQNLAVQSAGRSSMLTACGLALRRFHGLC